MDVLRSCYTRPCRFFTDSDDAVDVKWYWCAPDVRPLDFSHPFASANWYDDECLNQSLGELPLTFPKWRDGEAPPVTNPDHICGTLDQWQNGFTFDTFDPPVEYDEWDIPFCCYPDERDEAVGLGGLVLDGSAKLVTNNPPVGLGGLMLDGSAKLVTNKPPIGFGGLMLDGAAKLVTNKPPIGFGGLMLDGSAKLVTNKPPIGFGGLMLDGSASRVTNNQNAGDGGLMLDGSADLVTNFNPCGDGGLVLDGSADLVTNGPAIGDGGLALAGDALMMFATAAIGDGGLVLDGSAIIALNVPSIGDGGLVLDGTATPSAGFNPTIGDGGLVLDGTATPSAGFTPTIGDGALPLAGSATLVIPADPGADCPNAILMVNGVQYSGSLTAGQERWFYYPTLSGNNYSVHFTKDTGTTPTSTYLQGVSCASQTQLNNATSAEYTWTAFGSTGQKVYLRIVAGAGSCTFRFTLNISGAD